MTILHSTVAMMNQSHSRSNFLRSVPFLFKVFLEGATCHFLSVFSLVCVAATFSNFKCTIWKTAPLRQFRVFIGYDAGHFWYDLSFLCLRITFSNVHFIGFFQKSAPLR